MWRLLMDEHQDLQIMRSRVRLVFVALLSVTTGKPISSPQPDDTMDFSDMWSSDGGLFAEPAASLDSSVFLALNPVSSDAGWDYSMFSDGDGDISASVLDSDEANASNIDVSCISDSDVGSPSDLDILKSRDSLDETWTSFEPSTEKKVCPINREPQPPQQSPLQLPSLDQYDVTDECPPLPDGRQRHALCCYDPDVREPSGDIVAKNCWRLRFLEGLTWGCKKPGQEGLQRCCIIYSKEKSEGFSCTNGFEDQTKALFQLPLNFP